MLEWGSDNGNMTEYVDPVTETEEIHQYKLYFFWKAYELMHMN